MGDDLKKEDIKKIDIFAVLIKLMATIGVLLFSFYVGFILFLMMSNYNIVLQYAVLAIIPLLFLPLIWFKNKKRVFIFWFVYVLIFGLGVLSDYFYREYDKSITIDTSPNINVNEYLPFVEETKIVKLENSSLKLDDNLPILDGAAAVFPVYSAFVNAVYPDTIELDLDMDAVFQYNNTVKGYNMLCNKDTDIFFGGYPSESQLEYAKQQNTELIFTPIGRDGFVFFVHKDNPIDNLTSEQVRGIYSGQITNWKEVGGKNQAIVAYQRNEGSGSQSQLIRFMGDTEIMNPPSELVNTMMSGIIEQVSDYRSKSNSIGFSFRYYVDGIIKNPDIKMLSIDGVYPNIENIKNGSYPLSGYLYAVTYEGNDNENVQKLLDWVLSDEGQKIIEETGYVGVN